MPQRISAQSLADRGEEVTAALEDEASGTLGRLREKADQLVDRVRPRVDAVADYVRDEPTKAVLISAAVGAGLMALVALLARPSRTSQFGLPKSMPTSMSALRDVAMGMASNAQDAATKAFAKAQKQAQKRADQAKKDLTTAASDAADDANSKVADMWKSLRDQAAPMVDKIRPQFDAAAAYVKDDPTRATLGAVAAGAVLMGLMALLSGSDDD